MVEDKDLVEAVTDEVEDISLDDEATQTGSAADKVTTTKTDDSIKDEKVDEAKKADEDDDEEAPPLPTRKTLSKEEVKEPVNPLLKQLVDAFPNVEEKYAKAILVASQGSMDDAFNAMLYLSDPEGSSIELPTTANEGKKRGSTPRIGRPTQLEQDELLARQLDQQYNKSRKNRRPYNESERQAREARMRDRERRRQNPMPEDERREYYGEAEDDSWSQFVEKDLPEIRNMANRQIQETASRINNWLGGIRKSAVGEEDGQMYNNSPNRAYTDRNNSGVNNPERQRFNSFGATTTGGNSLQNHGISLRVDDDDEEDEGIPPQLPSRTSTNDSSGNGQQSSANSRTQQKITAQTAFIQTPDKNSSMAKSRSPDVMTQVTPTKISMSQNPDDDEFLLNSDDEL